MYAVCTTGTDFVKWIETVLVEEKNYQRRFERLIAEQYQGKGPFTAELITVLRFCLRESSISAICKKINQYVSALSLFAPGSGLVIVEEVAKHAALNFEVVVVGSFNSVFRDRVERANFTICDHHRGLSPLPGTPLAGGPLQP